MKTQTLYIEPDRVSFYRRLAKIFSEIAEESVSATGRFNVALSGGNTPRPLHRALAESPYAETLPWSMTHVFWVDERCVPVGDEASNYGNAEKDLIDKVPISPGYVHPMYTGLFPEAGAAVYERLLKSELRPAENENPSFDLILLGIGSDGHTASLFPDDDFCKDKNQWVKAVRGGNPHVDRLTLTLPVINQARAVLFMASGKTKARVVKAVLEDRPPELPASHVNPVNGRLIWVLDQEAAELLQMPDHTPSSQDRSKSLVGFGSPTNDNAGKP
jgi:6-phosphogluconolactonase